MKIRVKVLSAICLFAGMADAARLQNVLIADQEHIMVTVLDGEITHRDDGIGPGAFTTQNETDADTVKDYAPHLDTAAAQQAANWTLTSDDDANYNAGVQPNQVYRKTKLNGHAQQEWQGGDYVYQHTLSHTLFLELPQPLQQGAAYTLAIASATGIDQAEQHITFDIYTSISEAVHVNLVGYEASPTIKSADLHLWMGDGGSRDYSSFEGNRVYVVDTASGAPVEAGAVSFWKASGRDVGWYNLTRSAVWNVDFTGFNTPGVYRLAIEGVGCSNPFEIAHDIYYEPFMVGVQGFFYMRIGQDSGGGIWPVPRRPLFIPGDGENTTVYLTTVHPWNNWSSLGTGDNWDVRDWSAHRKAGNPTNPNARGGHSDALDWDRHLGHVSIIYDMLLPFILTKGAIEDDDLDIAESGNRIPDILDEARYEADFWLRLRDGAGYSHGMNNPDGNHVLYQAGPTAVAAWANAANAAMLADCFRISGHTDLMAEYRDSAAAAYAYAGALADPMLDETQNVGDNTLRGRDFKMTAAAYLYNLTGETGYEDAVNQESAISSGTSEFNDERAFNQTYALAGYLKTPQQVHYQDLWNNMKEAVIYQARTKEASQSRQRPSRRSTGNDAGYWRTAQNLQRTMIAHAVTEDVDDKTFFEDALILEADYGLGRNAMNMIQMTTQTTPLAHHRSIQGAYTSGRDDGAPGMHPGHTPYMNLDGWACRMQMGCPSRLYENDYPGDFKNTWPGDEAYHNTRYVWAHTEFTPQQTMRGKMALYGYLHGISIMSGDSTGVNRSLPVPLTAGKYQINIYDVSGRRIYAGLQDLPHLNAPLAWRPVKPGVYYIKIRKKDFVIIRRRCIW